MVFRSYGEIEIKNAAMYICLFVCIFILLRISIEIFGMNRHATVNK